MNIHFTEQLIACVICKDDRGLALSQLLLERFAQVYWIRSDSDYRQFSPGDRIGASIPRRDLPAAFEAVFFHSGNDTLWQNQPLATTYTFEFNTPGTPSPRIDVIPIFRATGTYFGINRNDICEVIDYITGQRQSLPSMCFPTLDAIPALSILCQAYLKLHNSHSQVTQSQWWLESLDCIVQGQPDEARINALKDTIAQEWKSGLPHGSDTAIQDLLTAILAHISASHNPPIDIAPVQAAYAAIAQKLGNTVKLPESLNWTTQVNQLLIIKGSFVSTAIATVTATFLKINKIKISIRHWNPNADPQTTAKLSNSSILLLPENQMKELAVLRSRQHNFRGAVLVISGQTFPALKQKYRILTCGQGSHSAFPLPWHLDQFQSQLGTLLPLQPENLRLWQQESQEFEQRNQQKINACQTRLDQLKQAVNPTPGEVSQHFTALESVIGDLRIQTKFACHTPIQLIQESNPRPIKDHLEQALRELQQPGKQSQAIQRLEQSLVYLSQLLISSVEFTSHFN